MQVHMPLRQGRRNEADDTRSVLKPLVGLLLFNGVGAVFGGIGLLMGWLGAPLSLLDGTPFTDYTIPAWILLAAVGGMSLGAALALWKRLRHAALAAMLAGAVLLGWIVTEFIMIPQGWAPQLLYLIVAVAILRYGWMSFQQGRAKVV